MRTGPMLLVAATLAGCAADLTPGAKSTLENSGDLPVPADLAVDRQWRSNADGYIFSVAYFTPEQERSSNWERARLESNRTVFLCGTQHIIRRDVRWFDPVAPGEPRCAMIIYSVSCSPRRPEWGSSMSYERQQMLLEDPSSLPSRGCGEKNFKDIAPPLNRDPAPGGAIVSEWADCSLPPDMERGRFNLQSVNYVNARSLVSPSFVRDVRSPYQGDATQHIGVAASHEQKTHIIVVKRPLPDDGRNIFIEQTFSSDGTNFCVTLSAKQGDNAWRKSLRGALNPSINNHNPADGPKLDQYALAKTLQLDLAQHLGIQVSRETR